MFYFESFGLLKKLDSREEKIHTKRERRKLQQKFPFV